MFERIEVEVDPELTAAFPARRLTAVQIELESGERLVAGPLQARGEPDDPELAALVAGKVGDAFDHAAADAAVDGGLRHASPSQLLALLRSAVVVDG
jgi:hypothetical protein